MKLILSILIAFCSIISFAQNKNITLEDIWQDYVFYPSSIQGLKSLNDGKHFSKITKEKNIQYLCIGLFLFGVIIYIFKKLHCVNQK